MRKRSDREAHSSRIALSITPYSLRPAILAPTPLVTRLDYASSPDFRAAVSRAQWAVIQTGLITSGLALFGVYVLATRINDLHLMNMYLWDWLPVGPMLVGLIAGSGYILASWWFGVRVGPGWCWRSCCVQLAMFLACHYADFETRDLVYRDTGQPVGFVDVLRPHDPPARAGRSRPAPRPVAGARVRDPLRRGDVLRARRDAARR